MGLHLVCTAKLRLEEGDEMRLRVEVYKLRLLKLGLGLKMGLVCVGYAKHGWGTSSVLG